MKSGRHTPVTAYHLGDLFLFQVALEQQQSEYSTRRSAEAFSNHGLNLRMAINLQRKHPETKKNCAPVKNARHHATLYDATCYHYECM